jgi:hypothetical protein
MIAAAIVMAPLMTQVKADETGKWSATFDGKAITSNFSQKEINDLLSDMQPGDSTVLTVSLTNAYKDPSSWYVKNEVLESFEDSSIANGGAYTYKLSYFSPDNQELVLFNSDNVGGKDSVEYLKEATQYLKDYSFIGKLNQGQTGRMELTVILEGETHRNDYQDTIANIMMKFAVELPETKEIIIRKRIPNTFDPYDAIPWLIASGISGLIILGIAIIRIRDSKEEA